MSVTLHTSHLQSRFGQFDRGKSTDELDNSNIEEPPNSPPLVYVPIRHGPPDAGLTRLSKDDKDLALSNNNLEVHTHVYKLADETSSQ